MNKIKSVKPVASKGVWLAFGLAMAVVAVYILIFLGALGIGGYDNEDAPELIGLVAAGGYLLGGFLLLARRRWLWIIGLLINSMVLLMYFSMHQGETAVLLSPGGLISKALQLLLELVLIFLIFAYKKDTITETLIR